MRSRKTKKPMSTMKVLKCLSLPAKQPERRTENPVTGTEIMLQNAIELDVIPLSLNASLMMIRQATTMESVTAMKTAKKMKLRSQKSTLSVFQNQVRFMTAVGETGLVGFSLKKSSVKMPMTVVITAWITCILRSQSRQNCSSLFAIVSTFTKITGMKRLITSLEKSTANMMAVERGRLSGLNQRAEIRVTILLMKTKEIANMY